MHSHDRTLLSRLGFSDQDKKDKNHDLAIQYLALPEIRNRIITEVLKGHPATNDRPRFEQAIGKGSGQYKTVIGFADLIIPYDDELVDDTGHPFRFRMALVVEVKITPVGVGEILRQLHLYREFLSRDSTRYLACTAFPLAKRDVAILAASRINHVELGEGFREWSKQVPEGESDASNSLSL